jgi:hypothetical protein
MGQVLLQEIVAAACPQASVEALDVGRSLVVGFHGPEQTVWIALDRRPREGTMEEILGCVANMLVFCENCNERGYPACHQQYRIISERLRRFLGNDHYQRFVANAPARRGMEHRPPMSPRPR